MKTVEECLKEIKREREQQKIVTTKQKIAVYSGFTILVTLFILACKKYIELGMY